ATHNDKPPCATAGSTLARQKALPSSVDNGRTKLSLAPSCTQACSRPASSSRQACAASAVSRVSPRPLSSWGMVGSDDQQQIAGAALRRGNEQAGAEQLVAQAIAGRQGVRLPINGDAQFAFQHQQMMYQAWPGRLFVGNASAGRQFASQDFAG